MAEFKPNEKFLDFLLKKAAEEAKDIDKPLFGNPDGTTKGALGWSMREIIEEIRAGEEKWRLIYERLYILEKNNFEDYLRDSQA